MTKPKISVIVPIYKVEKYIRECVDSILNQSLKEIEIILVDDGSPDRCPKICDEYASADNRVKVVHKENGGLSDARNFGLNVALGGYVAFVDGDDIISPVMYEIMLRVASENNADIVGCESVMFNEQTQENFPIYHHNEAFEEYTSNEFLEKLLYKKIDCSVCNKIFRLDVIKDSLFVKGRYNEDIIFLSEILCRCNRVVQLNQDYYKYRITPGSITHTFTNKSLDILENISFVKNNVRRNYKDLEDALFFYECTTTKMLATSVIRNRKQKEEPYRSAYLKAKQFLLSNMFSIWKCKDFNFRMKIASLLACVL